MQIFSEFLNVRKIKHLKLATGYLICWGMEIQIKFFVLVHPYSDFRRAPDLLSSHAFTVLSRHFDIFYFRKVEKTAVFKDGEKKLSNNEAEGDCLFFLNYSEGQEVNIISN